jgi:chemosensory pili system protein ChpA (sensor histidine kinase/response regulator)
VRLFPYYRALQELLGAERVHPGEMLVLDLSRALPACRCRPMRRARPGGMPRALRKGAAAFPEERQHAGHAAGELRERWRRSRAQQRRAAAMPSGWRCRPSPTWPPGQLASDIYLKQLLGQINLQLRRLVQGHTSLPEAMLRDACSSSPRRREPTPG